MLGVLVAVALLLPTLLFIFLHHYHKSRTQDKLQTEDSQYTQELLKKIPEIQQIGDKLADEVVAQLKKHPKGVKDFLQLVEEKAKNENSEACKQFLKQAFTAPSWLDPKKIEVAQTVYKKYATCFMLAGSASLIESFTIADGSEILNMTGKMGCLSHSLRRVFETQQMVSDLMLSPKVGDVLPGSEAHRTLLRVRLLHAWVRHFIAKQLQQQEQPKEYWDVEARGIPVNQPGMLFTATLFCYSQIKGAEALGAIFTDYEKECYWHLWKYAAIMLGTDEHLLPLTYEDQVRAHHKITKLKRDVTVHGINLTHQTILAMSKGPQQIEENYLHSMVRMCTRDDEMCDMLKLQPVGTKSWILLNLFKLYTMTTIAVCYAIPSLWQRLLERRQRVVLNVQNRVLKERAEYRFESF